LCEKCIELAQHHEHHARALFLGTLKTKTLGSAEIKNKVTNFTKTVVSIICFNPLLEL
jgi:hypothetical protein